MGPPWGQVWLAYLLFAILLAQVQAQDNTPSNSGTNGTSVSGNTNGRLDPNAAGGSGTGTNGTGIGGAGVGAAGVGGAGVGAAGVGGAGVGAAGVGGAGVGVAGVGGAGVGAAGVGGAAVNGSGVGAAGVGGAGVGAAGVGGAGVGAAGVGGAGVGVAGVGGAAVNGTGVGAAGVGGAGVGAAGVGGAEVGAAGVGGAGVGAAGVGGAGVGAAGVGGVGVGAAGVGGAGVGVAGVGGAAVNGSGVGAAGVGGAGVGVAGVGGAGLGVAGVGGAAVNGSGVGGAGVGGSGVGAAGVGGAGVGVAGVGGAAVNGSGVGVAGVGRAGVGAAGVGGAGVGVAGVGGAGVGGAGVGVAGVGGAGVGVAGVGGAGVNGTGVGGAGVGGAGVGVAGVGGAGVGGAGVGVAGAGGAGVGVAVVGGAGVNGTGVGAAGVGGAGVGGAGTNGAEAGGAAIGGIGGTGKLPGSTVNDGTYTEADILGDFECDNMQSCRDTYGQKAVVCVSFTSSTDPTIFRCVCDKQRNFHRVDNTAQCVVHSLVGEMCAPGISECVVKNSECTYTPVFGGIQRCQCKLGFKEVTTSPGILCGRVISALQNPLCALCEGNEATCYDTGDESSVGCICPTFRTGPMCETIHVFVKCNMETFSMDVCYDPHIGVDFNADKPSVLYTQNHMGDVACRGVPPPDGACVVGSRFISLSLEEDKRDRCGTTKLKPDSETLKYENRLEVTLGLGDQIIFDTFCMFSTSYRSSFSGVASVNTPLKSEVGTDYLPDMSFHLENQLGQVIPQHQALILQDPIYLVLELSHQDKSYGAMRVENCILSNVPSTSDSEAYVQPLLNDGCPVNGQEIMTEKNMFQPDGGDLHTLRTLPVQMVKIGGAATTFIHCRIKLCLKGEVSSCLPYSCSGSQKSRKRRAVSDPQLLEVSQPFVWEEGASSGDDDLVMSKTMFAVGCTLVLLLLLVFMASTIAMAIHIVRLRNGKMGVNPFTSRHFHNPRFA